MDFYSFTPVAVVIDAAYAVFMGLAVALDPMLGATSAAAAVVLVTLAVRAALVPVGIAQAKAEQTRARLAPRVRDLQLRHKKDPERMQRELAALYSDEGTTPLAGCLPMLVQIPVVGVIYAVFILPTINGHSNLLLEQTFGGVSLGSSLAGMIGEGGLDVAAGCVFGVIIALIIAVGEATRRLSRPGFVLAPPRPSGGASTGGRAGASGTSVRASDAAAGPAAIDPAKLAPMLGALQFITAVVAMFVPLAAALYLAVTVSWSLGQRVVLRRRYPLPSV